MDGHAMLSILLNNLWGYDLIIVIAAIVNLMLFVAIQRQLSAIKTDFVKTSYLQNDWLVGISSGQCDKPDQGALLDVLNHFTKRKHTLDQLSVFYTSLTGIFPLLGILGTVAALLTMTDFNDVAVMVNFSKALSSTFWGVFFGALGKFGEGFFTAETERYDKLYHELRSGFITVGERGE